MHTDYLNKNFIEDKANTIRLTRVIFVLLSLLIINAAEVAFAENKPENKSVTDISLTLANNVTIDQSKEEKAWLVKQPVIKTTTDTSKKLADKEKPTNQLKWFHPLIPYIYPMSPIGFMSAM